MPEKTRGSEFAASPAFDEASEAFGRLLRAAASGDNQEVRELLARGVNADASASHGWTALHLAAMGGTAEIVQALVAGGATVGARNKLASEELAKAVIAGNVHEVNRLLDEGRKAKRDSHEYHSAKS